MISAASVVPVAGCVAALWRFRQGAGVMAVVALGGVWVAVAAWATVRTAAVIRHLDRAAEEATRQFESVAAQSRNWIWQADADAILTYSSPGVRHLLGYDAHELIGTSMFDLLTVNAERPELTLSHIDAGAQAGWNPTEASWRHANGHPVRLVGTIEPIIEGGGTLIGYRGVRLAAEDKHSDLVARRQAIRQIIAERSFEIALQPIVDVARGEWVGAEALARFASGATDATFAEAQEVGLSEELEAATAAAALDHVDQLPSTVYLAVNLSPVALGHPAIMDLFERRVDQLPRIVIELTEHLSISDYDRVLAVLRPLRRMGLRLAIDDAGAGYASFLHVVRLRPSIIKLDRNLVTNIGCEPAKRAVARAVCSLAAELGAVAVAEGAESDDDIRSAAALGLLLQQGYGIAHPTTDPRVWSSWRARSWRMATEPT